MTSSQATSNGIQLSIYSARDWPQISHFWGELEKSSPYSSFYLSTDWTAAWLEIFGELLQPQLLVFKNEEFAVAVCLLVESIERRGPFRVKQIYMNTSGEDVDDRTLMEFNGLLCREGWEDAVSQVLSEHLQTLRWDEFAVDGILPGKVLNSLKMALPQSATSLDRPSFYVNLEQLRSISQPFESTLSSNTREQLRRSMRLYSALGEIRVQVASSLSESEEFFEELRQMHQARWERLGETGAFPPGRRLEFHRALIRRAFASGSIQMLRVSAGTETIGVLYNFVRDGKVYFFQSGFQYKPDKRLKPGLVTHVCAIQYCLQAGFSEYDLLAGDARYKRSLAKDCRQMAWVVFARPSLKLGLIERLRAVKRLLKKSSAKGSH
ncbi:MAG TPA: GNAT family N-acetyltransferase [Terriglobales bacterium]|nr:GNAT family N-acetyltransferase [Terriglobales bacterium]